ncbi:MAG: type II toxin-antitoxin system VapC family toxin [archaeon]
MNLGGFRMRLYLDSNVLISYLRSEINGAFNLLFQDAKEFFSLCKKEKIELVVSELFILEVMKVVSLSEKDILEFFCSFGLKTVFVKSVEITEAFCVKKSTGIHFTDSQHIANALKYECDYIITWNKKDFKKAKDLIDFKTPKIFLEEF